MTESYPALKRTDIQDPTCLDRSPRKILFNYDCQSIPFYENQEGSIRDLAERENVFVMFFHNSFQNININTEKDKERERELTIHKPH